MRDERLRFRIEGRTQLIASRGERVLWRWRARKPLHCVGVAQRILLVRERLAQSDAGVTDRVAGLCAATGRRLWQTIHERLSEESEELYGRLLLLYRPDRVYAMGNTLVMDIRTGKTVLTTRAAPKRKTPREVLWIDPPGPAPYQNGGTLTLIRLDPQTLQSQRLDLPLPRPSGIGFDEHPTCDVRVAGDRIEAIYGGFKGKSSQRAYFLARYRWSAGPGQKPEIQPLEREPR